MTTRTLPLAPCHWVALGEPHEAHPHTVRMNHGKLYLVARRTCPGFSEASPAGEPQIYQGAMHEAAAQDSTPLPRVRCGHCQGYHASVDAVKRCAGVDDPFRRATNADERAEEDRQAAAVPVRRAPAEEGMYKKDGVIYKVQVAHHGSGKPYAKLLRQDPSGKWMFIYAPGMVRELGPEHKLTLEQAKEFGALYGTCCVCGRVLTNEESIAVGIGPVCAGKL